MFKKLLFISLMMISISFLSSCIISESFESHINDFLNGTWKIGETENTITIQNDGVFFINDSIEGKYVVKKVEDNHFSWAWESNPNAEHTMIWNIENKNGELTFFDYVENCNTVLVKGVPFFFENDTTILYKLD